MARMISSAAMLDDVTDEFEDEANVAERERVAQQERRDRMTGLVQVLKSEADTRAGERTSIEQQWVEDLLQYHEKFTAAEISDFEEDDNLGRSQVYISKTRQKTNGMIARLENILFPVDDRNWSIGPSPVPEMAEKAKAAGERLDMLQQQQADPNQPNPDPAEVDELQQAVDEHQAIMAAATAKAGMMQAEIADQLAACRYQAQCRDVLEDGVKVGTGLLLGPIAGEKPKRKWQQVPLTNEETGEPEKNEDGSPMMVHELVPSEDLTPAAFRLDYWNVFPSSDARGCADSEGFFIRHSWTAKQVRAFARIPGAIRSEVEHILKDKPADPAPNYLGQLRAIGAGNGAVVSSARFYTVWQYIGPLTAEHMKIMAEHAGDAKTAKEMTDASPLDEQMAIVWFCNDTLLKFAIYPLDSEAPIINAWRFEKEEGSFWGYGMPRIIRNPDALRSSMWRLLGDNAELSAGGMVAIDDTKLQAADGNNKRLFGRKVFKPVAGKSAGDVKQAIQYIEVPVRVDQISAIIDMTGREIDEASHQPSMGGDGEKVPQVTNTATGTALWINSFNVMLIRAIRNWDDDLTTPVIQNFYDWNMQFSEKEEIKGDYQCQARGASILLVRELQAANILTLTLALTQPGSPFAPFVKEGPSVREVYRSHQLPPDEFVRTDADAAQKAQEMAEQAAAAAAAAKGPAAAGPDPDIEKAKIDQKDSETEARVAIAQSTNASREKVAQLNYEAKMADIAAMLNISQDELEAQMAEHREKVASNERSMAVEAALRSSEKAPENETQIGQMN